MTESTSDRLCAVQLNSQSLVFGKYRGLFNGEPLAPTDHYCRHGYDVLPDVPDITAAASIIARTVDDHIDLAKADEIPVCADVVESEYQVLHFDMGMPLVPCEDEQLLITHVGIYLPEAEPEPEAETRILELAGLAAGLSTDEADCRLERYAQRFGDGWGDINTGRLACFARVLDALDGTTDFAADRDRPVGQWFRPDARLSADEAFRLESDYFRTKGIDLEKVEQRVALRPGDLLLIDNLRVVHGRIGHRREREICNLMFGVERLDASDVAIVRRSLAELIATPEF